jgi:hypothetical protein
MSALFVNHLPADFVKRLYKSESEPNGCLTFPAKERHIALGWLRRVLLDFEALDLHISLLQELYGTSFAYPRPRRERWNISQPLDAPQANAFNHSQRLSEQRVAAILDDGIDILSDEELAELLLNPFALYDLFDVIDDVQPDNWMDAMHNLATSVASLELTGKHRSSSTSPPKESRAPLRSSFAALPDSFWTQFQENLSTAIRQSHAIPPVPSQRTRALQYAMALAASVALIIVGWSVIQMSSAVRTLPEQLAMLTKQGGATSPGAIEFHSTTVGRPANWQEIWTNNYLASDTDVANLNRLSFALQAQKLVDQLRAKGHSDKDILIYLKIALDVPNP